MTGSPKFVSSRNFEVWSYTVSHGQLLIRSNATVELPTRLEILFKNVSYMRIPVIFEGLEVYEAEKPRGSEVLIGGQWFRLKFEGGEGYIGAGAFVTGEDQLPYHQPSLLLRGPHL